jgi:hypothetical protein
MSGGHTRPWLWVTGVAVVALIVLIAGWPYWTLRYMHVLAWPVVAVIAMAIFGPPLARRIPDLLEASGPGVGVKFAQSNSEQPEELDEEVWGPPIDWDELARESEDAHEQGEGPPSPPSPEMVEAFNLVLDTSRVITFVNSAFQMQLNFLDFLGAAEDGLTAAAADQWFATTIETNPVAKLTTWNIHGLLTFMVNGQVAAIGEDGKYRITPFGQDVRARVGPGGLWYAPKLY